MTLFLAGLAFTIHFIMLSTDRFNWIEGPRPAVAIQNSAVPPSR
jgi:light-harvesting complex 1 alpha chain